MMALRDKRLAATVVVWLVLALPPARHALEASMTTQMLLQLPLLALAGAWLARGVPPAWSAAWAAWNRGGVTGLVLASMASMPWMLPRAMDAAVDGWPVELLKFASVPLLIGLPFALTWPRMGFVVRGVFFSETIATCFRLGWLYRVSPERLCSNYLLDDQQRLGNWLLLVGAAIFLLLALKLMAGRFTADGGHDTV